MHNRTLPLTTPNLSSSEFSDGYIIPRPVISFFLHNYKPAGMSMLEVPRPILRDAPR